MTNILELARQAGISIDKFGMGWNATSDEEGVDIEAFAALIRDDLIAQGYRQCAVGQGTSQFCGQPETAKKQVRIQVIEECAKVCDRVDLSGMNEYPFEQRFIAETIACLQKCIRALAGDKHE